MRTVPTAPSSTYLNRRHAARLIPAAHLSVKFVSLPLAIELHDLSLGGFSITAGRPFPIGLTHRFVIATPEGAEVRLVAKVIHCYSRVIDGVQSFVTGWEFMAGSADATAAALSKLCDTATV
jgi:hypothetical protein